MPWTLVEHGDAHVVSEVTDLPQPGWPGVLHARLTYRLTEDGLHVTLEATNVGETDVPFGYGAHPYLTVGEARSTRCGSPCRPSTYLEVDDRLLPVGLAPVDGTDLDLRDGAPVGSRVLDKAYTDLERDADGGWTVRPAPRRPPRRVVGRRLVRWAQVFTGGKRRDVGSPWSR